MCCSRTQSLTIIAPGDIRNVVTTVASFPQRYLGKPSIVINDLDFVVVARDAIMLLLALTIKDQHRAAETILHCWYSALIRPIDLESLEALQPLIQDVCTKIVDREAGSLQAKTFTFNKCSIRLILVKEAWRTLLSYLSVPLGLSTQRANAVRLAVTKPLHRLNYLHRNFLTQQPEHRICKNRFREDGILMAFGRSREDFTVPNPYVQRKCSFSYTRD